MCVEKGGGEEGVGGMNEGKEEKNQFFVCLLVTQRNVE
jgi:hypothetical protein